MTDERLRDLLDERVADLEPTDLGEGAWRAARRVRRRRAATTAAAAVAAVVLALVVVRPTGEDGGPVRPVQPVGTPTASGAVDADVERGGEHRGAPTWWAPDVAGEAGLPVLDGTPFPAEIDLADGAPAHRPGVEAVAVFEVAGEGAGPGRVVVVGTDRTSYSLDVARLDPVTDEEGNVLSPLGEESLSPDGRHVFFVQERSLEVYDLREGTWDSYETVPWLAEGARWISATEVWAPGELGPPDGTGTTYDVTGAEPVTPLPSLPRVRDVVDEPYGPVRTSSGGGVAQAEYLADPVTAPDGRSEGSADALAARVGSGDVHLLVMPGQGGRWKACCPVVGWLDDRTVLLQSRSGSAGILAWRVGTPDLRRVSRLVGWAPGDEVPIGSFADPS
ncbi:hypothetical protein ASE01_07830 [Nocardioides sp. Root190]|uniref:hypothetical protein n=1 Tax=Nocardioides sp. Root190 TaxID=1736488 RepID=UPI0006FB9473|nr:hypothetical protein [Nocardioides sp. Root190]KRB78066.1 hypothetical protein ASE01_07830 [Nocardioides sp. Root190]